MAGPPPLSSPPMSRAPPGNTHVGWKARPSGGSCPAELLAVQWRHRNRARRTPAWVARLDMMSPWAAAAIAALLQPWTLVAAAAVTAGPGQVLKRG